MSYWLPKAPHHHYSDLDLNPALVCSTGGNRSTEVEVHIANGNHHAPGPGRILAARLTYSAAPPGSAPLNLEVDGQTLVPLRGSCRPLFGEPEKYEKAGFACALTGSLGPLPGDKVHAFWSRWPSAWDLSGAFNLSSTLQEGKIQASGKIGEAVWDLQGNLNAGAKPAVFDLDLDLKGLTTAQLKEIQDLKGQPLQTLTRSTPTCTSRAPACPGTPSPCRAAWTFRPSGSETSKWIRCAWSSPVMRQARN